MVQVAGCRHTLRGRASAAAARVFAVRGCALLVGLTVGVAGGGSAGAATTSRLAATSPNQAASSSPAAPGVTPVGDTQLDARALYFVSYDGLVNNESFQLSGILSHAGYQYTAWYTADRRAVLARRQLPAGAWQTLTLAHALSTNDAHNVISLGISPRDGRLHVAMDTHGNAVWYTRSLAGLVSSPGGYAWSVDQFEAVGRTLDGVDLGAITYPQFVVSPDGALQLSYRTGGSGNGSNELAEYDGTWHRLGTWQSPAGPYIAGGATSTSRNMYLHGLTYGPDGTLHASFTWREGNSAVLCASGGLANHDTGYVTSDDRGRTWRNGAGQVVGMTGSSTQVSIGSPGLVVDALDPNHGLMNQESQDVDATGAPHVIISYVPGRFTQCVTSYAADRAAYARSFHLYRDAAGSWHKMEIPVPPQSTGRSQLVLDAADNAYVVMPFGRVVAASRASGWTDWTTVFDGSGLNAFGEVVVDRTRARSDGVLSVLYQQRSDGTTPSPIRVLDLRLGQGQA